MGIEKINVNQDKRQSKQQERVSERKCERGRCGRRGRAEAEGTGPHGEDTHLKPLSSLSV